MEEEVKSLIVGAKILSKRTNTMWDKLLASARLQTEYMDTKKPGWFYTGWPKISGWTVFFTLYECFGNDPRVLIKEDISTGDFVFQVILTQKCFLDIPVRLTYGSGLYQSKEENCTAGLWRKQTLIKRMSRLEFAATAKAKYLERSSRRG